KSQRLIPMVLFLVFECLVTLQASDSPGIEKMRAAILMHQQQGLSGSIQPAKVVDVGNVTVMTGNQYTYIRKAPFNLQNKSVVFAPNSSGGYSYKVTSSSATITDGPVKFRYGSYKVPFAAGFHFPFYGKTYSSVFLNSDGGLTFGEGSNLGPELIPY